MRAMPTPFYLSIMNLVCVLEFHVYNYEFNNSLHGVMHPRKHHFKIQ